MKVTPTLRHALHQCVDLLCDAIAEEQRSEPTKKRRARATPPAMPADVTAEELADVVRHLARAGYSKPT